MALPLLQLIMTWLHAMLSGRHEGWCPDTSQAAWEYVLNAWRLGTGLWQGDVAVTVKLYLFSSPYGWRWVKWENGGKEREGKKESREEQSRGTDCRESSPRD